MPYLSTGFAGAGRVWDMVDETFVRRAVQQADANSLRMALYQATADPEIAAFKTERISFRGGAGHQIVVSAEHDERLREMAVQYLLNDAADHVTTIPDDTEIDRLICMAEDQPVADHLLNMRRRLVCFDQFPHRAHWSGGGRPDLPDGFEVTIIGAGFSGVVMGVQLGLLGIPYTILERRHEVGGVWSINTYPDVRVDTRNSTYEFSFEKNYPWTEYFARQPEVRAYLEHIASKHGVAEHIQFGQDVKSATWDEKTKQWHLAVASADGGKRQVSSRALVSAVGLFAVPRDIDIEGAADFTGELVHTTQWGSEHTAAGKRVAVIGNGSTGVQLLSKVAQDADAVHVFQRTPQWIAPRERYGEKMTDEVRWLLQAMPYYWNWSRYVDHIPLLDARELTLVDHDWVAQGGHVNRRNDQLREGLTQYIKAQVGDRPDLVERLIPNYAPIARRPVVDNGWYQALTQDHVELVTTPIRRITENGIETTDGTHRELDMIIAAVGFQAGRYLWPTEYTGVGGTTLEDMWSKEGAKAYLTMTVPKFPNLFMLYGPNSQPISGGSGLIGWFEIWSAYIAQALVMLIEGDHRVMEVREDVWKKFNDDLDQEATKLVYGFDKNSKDKNYYVNEWGRLQVNFPWEAEDFYQMSSRPRSQDFHLR